ncbi:MAG: hypothetical protein AAGD04_12300 [Pseudomonadota bacterium]
MMHVFALYLEIANPQLSGSACHVGLSEYKDGSIKTESWLVNPDCAFDEVHMAAHNIRPDDVLTAPGFAGVFRKIKKRTNGAVIVTHTKLGRIAFEDAAREVKCGSLNATWLNLTKVARNAWPDRFGRTPYGIDAIARGVEVEIVANDAPGRAETLVRIMAQALEKTGIPPAQWVRVLAKPKRKSVFDPEKPNPYGAYFGKRLVFTGAFTMPREIAAKRATAEGYLCQNQVTPDTDILVFGKLPRGTNAKVAKAQALMEAGYPVEVLSEEAFFARLGYQTDSLTAPEILKGSRYRFS